jgi:hypothetical protein
MLRICLFAAAIAAFGIGAGMPVDAKPTATEPPAAQPSVAELASVDESQPAVAADKPDEVRNARARKKPRMVLRCVLFGRYIQGCNPG